MRMVFLPNAQAWWHQTPLAPVSRTGGEAVARLAQNPHPLPGKRMKHSPRGGIDEQTLEIRAAELTTSDVGDAPSPLCQGSCPLLYFSSISQVGGIGR